MGSVYRQIKGPYIRALERRQGTILRATLRVPKGPFADLGGYLGGLFRYLGTL